MIVSMRKKPKPGQFFSVNGKVYRVMKRTNGCDGCVLNQIYLCPSIRDIRYNSFNPECAANGIIFVDI
nr:MAG TPA: ATP-binding sugar transporter [Caudoviricetes sp.]